jgi:sulfur carrier protein ThiS
LTTVRGCAIISTSSSGEVEKTMESVIAQAIEAIASAEKMREHEVVVSVNGNIVSQAEPYNWEWLEAKWDAACVGVQQLMDGESRIAYIFTKGAITFTLIRVKGM